MRQLRGACIIGQSGGPTAAINASVLGAIHAAFAADCITNVLGAANGIKGVMDDIFYDLTREDLGELELLKHSPSSALGSSRFKLSRDMNDESEYERILEVFKKYDVRYFFFNGGNDSMDTCNKISKFLQKSGYPCRVMGIPKTVDNDLAHTDHCPGYGSAAKYVATSCMEVYHDVNVYDTSQVVIMEIMGRNAGWLAASSALAQYKGCGPDLIYVPEVPFDIDRFARQVEEVYMFKGKCFVAVSEGIRDKDGTYISSYSNESAANQMDAFGHAQMGGLASILAHKIKLKRKVKVRPIELSLLQRCAAHCASKTDIEEAYLSGRTAVEAAVAGETDKMVGFEREPGLVYKCKTKLIPLEDCANAEKKLPLEWITIEGNGVRQPFIDYALPLIQGDIDLVKEDGLPRFARLKKIQIAVK